MSLNIRSLFKNIDYIRENNSHFQNFDVLAFNETNCDPSTLPNGFDDTLIDGFHPPIIKKNTEHPTKVGDSPHMYIKEYATKKISNL